MSEVFFYHLEHIRLEHSLPQLLEKTLTVGKRALVLAGSEARVEFLANALWTYDPGSWLPHGTAKDGCAEHQPIWLTTEDVNTNNANFVFLMDGTMTERLSEFERCFVMFDGNDSAMVERARYQWKIYKEENHELIYWQHQPSAGWQKKAVHSGKQPYGDGNGETLD